MRIMILMGGNEMFGDLFKDLNSSLEDVLKSTEAGEGTIKDNMDSPHSPTKLSGIMRCNPKVIPNDIMETTIIGINT